jgi:hypothetical protein
MNWERRLKALEKLAAEALPPPDFDARSELIKRVNQVAERAAANGYPVGTAEGDPKEAVEYFKEWVRGQ